MKIIKKVRWTSRCFYIFIIVAGCYLLLPSIALGAKPPKVTIEVPQSGDTISGTVNIIVRASGCTWVDFYIDDVRICQDDTPTPDDGWSCSWDTTEVINGQHVIKAVATEETSSKTATDSINVFVSNNESDCTVKIIEPLPDDILKEEIDIRAQTFPTGLVKWVKFFIDGVLLDGDGEPDQYDQYDEWLIKWNTVSRNNRDYVIEAKATDQYDKTATDCINVFVNNSVHNVSPVANIYYTCDGYKYYFYPDESADSDGYITKYQYTISEVDSSEDPEPEWYSCYGWSECPSRPFPGYCQSDQDRGFCLFFSCPYIGYEFPEYGQYEVELTVWDNQGNDNTITETIMIEQDFANNMYMWSIYPKTKSTGSVSTLKLTVLVLHESNWNYLRDSNDLPLAGAVVSMELMELKDNDETPICLDLGNETTNQYGEATFTVRGLSPGDYSAKVTNLYYPDDLYQWNPEEPCMTNPRHIRIW